MFSFACPLWSHGVRGPWHSPRSYEAQRQGGAAEPAAPSRHPRYFIRYGAAVAVGNTYGSGLHDKDSNLLCDR